MSSSHPCGHLPVDGIHLSAWYCRYHQAWWLRAEHLRQEGEEAVETVASWSQELGPFDGTQAASRELVGQLLELLTNPDAPWDARS